MRRTAFSGGLDGWLLIVCGMAMGLAPVADASARDDEARAKRDFDGLVHTVEARYQMHASAVPMMWIANLCARGFTHGGVQGMRVVEFKDADRIVQAGEKPGDFGELVKTQLGERWSPMVRAHEKSGADSYVYVQSSDESKRMRMIVVDLDGTELDVVSLSLNPDQLAKWLKEHDSDSAKMVPESGGSN